MTHPPGGENSGVGSGADVTGNSTIRAESARDPSRRLLARLRDVMAGSGSAQARLDKIVTLIAAEMHAEVCSCYVSRPGEVLELFATVGLNPDAVHRTRLRVGEGLVGDIAAHARPIAVANAQNAPQFAYRPETGEDPYRSLLGVPILRGGRVRGVLVIQNQEPRAYGEEAVETLQTIAMVVAELLTSGELVSAQEVSSVGDSGLMPTRLDGVVINRGLAMGLAVLHRPQLTIREMVADDPEAELARLRQAVHQMHSAIDALVEATKYEGSGEHRDILETYRMFAEDRGWMSRIREAINAGLTAEAAVQRVQDDTRARMGQLTDPYIRERLLDLDDLTNRLLKHLSGKRSEADMGTLPDDIVLFARSMGPAELLDYDKRRLRALVLEDGSPSSHVAIMARALDIPVVGKCENALTRVEPLDPVVVDGDNAQIFVRPAEDIQETFARSMALRDQRRSYYREVRFQPPVTLDGHRISILMNAGLLIDLPHLEDSGAEGIGLYRTEIPFMVRSAYPDVPTQVEIYSTVLDRAGRQPVIFRTLDVGGDKLLPYFTEQDEENPALGWRAIRIGLDRPAMLRKQLRALLRAARGRELRVMFPLVAEVAELKLARRILAMELERCAAEKLSCPNRIHVGIMLEVPALLWQMPQLLEHVDFISIGSNDLLQYMFAADRNNQRLNNRYDSLSPAMLSALKYTIEECDRRNVPVSLCGEMAGNPIEAMALIGLGLRTLSMSPQGVGPVKTMLRSLNVAQLKGFLNQRMRGCDHSVRKELVSFARDHGVVIEDIARHR